MKEKLLSFTESVKALWNRTSRRMRVLFLSGTAAILIISLVAVLMLNRSDYVILADNLSTSESAEIIALLQETGIDGVLDGNRLMVQADQENAARMQMATKGFSTAGLDYDTYFDRGMSLTATQSDKQIAATAALQDRLQATIKTFPEVTDAIVTISIPEKDVFVLESDVVPPKASVKLQVRPGRDLTAEQIQGIINIVQNAVPGLTEDNISIADQSGDLLGTLRSGSDAVDKKQKLTEVVNNDVKRRIMTMLGPLYGEERVVVAPNVVLNTDQTVIESQQYNPIDEENPANNPFDYVEIQNEFTGADGGVATGVPGANDNVDVPEYMADQADMENAEYYSTHRIYDYLVGSTKSQIVSEGYEISDLTVAVLIDAETLPDGQRDQVIDLVANAAGIARDRVSVQNIQFYAQAQAGTIAQQQQQEMQRMLIIGGIALIALVIIFIIVMTMLSRRRRKKELAAQAAMMGDGMLVDYGNEMAPYGEGEYGEGEEGEEGEAFEPIVIPTTNEQKLRAQIRDLADSDPAIVAQLLKTWLLSQSGSSIQ